MEIAEFLKKVKELATRQEEVSRSTGENFNVFKLCGVDHYENAHSDIIAEFLNPKGSHGCGSDLFQAFCKITGLDFFKYGNAEVIREYWIDDGRLDILIRAGENKIAIENKIYAIEQQDQLPRYRKWLDDVSIDKKEAPLLFLTLDGKPSSDENVDQNQYVCISYREHIIPWLTECVRLAVEKPFVRESLLQYKKLVEELVEGETMKIDENLSKAIQGDFKSAIQVRDYVDAVKAEWLYDFVLSKFAEENGILKDTGIKFEILGNEGKAGMIAKHDVFFSFTRENQGVKTTVMYAFNNYGFKTPRREVTTTDKDGHETKTTSTKECPHNWDDDFFREITQETSNGIASKAKEAIIRDLKNYFPMP